MGHRPDDLLAIGLALIAVAMAYAIIDARPRAMNDSSQRGSYSFANFHCCSGL